MVLLGKLKKIADIPPSQESGEGKEDKGSGDTAKLLQSISEVASPATQSQPLPGVKDNVWRNVFDPGSDLFNKAVGAKIVQKPEIVQENRKN